ncbi:MAG: DNA polymerase I [Candidatus Tectomicrobia bacterium]|nr:DNA polymerase I [Candidatus Tectomicrobia bacterium]
MSPKTQKTPSRPLLFLIDGSSYVYRAYHAIKSGLTNSKGLPTNAVFGYTQMLLKVLREQSPTHCAVAFDLGPPKKRLALFSAYKANRAETPEGLLTQWPYCREMTRVLGVPIVEEEGVEADDLIGTLTRRAEAAGFDVTIITADKDFYQLVSPRVTLWDTLRDRRIGLAEVEERFSVPPERVADVLALMGDSVDNVPGVPGVGEKTAKALIQRYGDVESLLGRLDEIDSDKQRERLKENADQARLSRTLVTIETGLDLEVGVEDLRIQEMDREAALTLLKELEFNRLANEILAGTREEAAAEKRYAAVLDEAEFEELVKRLEGSRGFAVDLETTHKEPMWAEIVGVALSRESGEGHYIPLAHDYMGAPAQLPAGKVLGRLKPLLEDPAIPKYGQNIKYDMIVFSRAGIALRGVAFDTMLASYVLNPIRRGHNLEEIAREFLNYQVVTYPEVAGSGAKEKPFNQVDVETAARYSAEDAEVAYTLVEVLGPKLEESGLRPVFDELEMPLVPVLAAMEEAGVLIDPDLLREMGKSLEAQMEAALRRIHEAAGREVNPNSPVQLREVLFDKLQLHRLAPPGTIKRTKTGMSTGADVLEKLAPLHPLPQEILSYRELAKLQSTYVEALPKLVHPGTGRIHTSFNQSVAATGRLSSSDPNLQNIPIRTELGRQIRRAFISSPGWKMLSADYSQVELRILAHLSGDEKLTEAFRAGEDVHTRTALEVFRVLPGTVTDEMRRMAKAVNYGVVYGLSPFGLSQGIGVPVEEARRFIDGYFERHAGVRAYIDKTLAEARERGYVETLRGRRRPIPDINHPNANLRGFAERTAVNTTVQGSAADIIKAAMIQIHRRLAERDLQSRMLLQVHDELVFEGPPGEMDGLAALVKEEMEGAAELSVPLLADTHTGDNWDEAH